MNTQTNLDCHFIQKASTLLSRQQDRDFLARVWRTEQGTYIRRLRSLGFEGMERVLDVGCGMGQWTAALACLNQSVVSLDSSVERLNVARRFCRKLELDNVTFIPGSAESLPFPTDHFDGVFSYSVLYLTDYPGSLRELHRTVTTGGRVYFSTNDLGWYLWTLVASPYATTGFSPRRNALKVLLRSVLPDCVTDRFKQRERIMPKGTVLALLEEIGFREILVGEEGNLAKSGYPPALGFFPGRKFGFNAVYEVLCRK